MADRTVVHDKLKERIQSYHPETTHEMKLTEISNAVLDSNPPDREIDSQYVLEFFSDTLPPSSQFFDDLFFAAPLMTISNLERAFGFYGIKLSADTYLESPGVKKAYQSYRRLQIMVWLCDLMGLQRSYARYVISKYACQMKTPNVAPELDVTSFLPSDTSSRREPNDIGSIEGSDDMSSAGV